MLIHEGWGGKKCDEGYFVSMVTKSVTLDAKTKALVVCNALSLRLFGT